MAPIKELKPEQVAELHTWLRTMGMPVNRQFSRDYSDGVLVAKLLKQLYPKAIDMNGYQARFSQELKMVNWQMLHFKILSKIGLPLSREYMYNLAKGDLNSLERLLWALMTSATMPDKERNDNIHLTYKESQTANKARIGKKVFNKRSKLSTATKPNPLELNVVHPKRETSSSSNSNVVIKNKKIVDITEEAMIPYAMYEGAINEIQLKDKNIEKYESKISFLEDLVKEKDTEIDLLKKRVSQGLLAI